jgi:hypothetical protein
METAKEFAKIDRQRAGQPDCWLFLVGTWYRLKATLKTADTIGMCLVGIPAYVAYAADEFKSRLVDLRDKKQSVGTLTEDLKTVYDEK